MKRENGGEGLWGLLSGYGRGDCYPMHMPGHKRRGEPVCGDFPWQCDITEIDGFDDLHDPQGVLREAQDRAARLYGSNQAWFLVNGSTCGVLAAIGAAARTGDTVLVARNCHRSAFHALELWGLLPVWLAPRQGGLPFCGSIAPETVASALARHREAKAVVLTSPTYEGILSDVAAIAAICHRQGVALIVDEAHGAHLGFAPGFPKSAVQCGADLVVQSLHKTLPAPTQTALLHRCGGLVDPARVTHLLDILQTSSPSYLLMAMMDSCLRFLEREGPAYFSAYREQLDRFAARCKALERLRLLTEEDFAAGHGFCWGCDPGKLLVDCRRAAIDGPTLAQRLREDFRIETEMAQPGCLLAMTSLMDSGEGFDRLAAALVSIDKRLAPADKPPCPSLPPAPAFAALPVREALEADWEEIPWHQAAGRVSAEYVFAYPPGIPWLAPGEVIGEGCVLAALQAGEAGVALKRTRAAAPGTAAVLKIPRGKP